MAFFSRFLAWFSCCSLSSTSLNTAAADPTEAKNLPSTNNTRNKEVESLEDSSRDMATDLPSIDKSGNWEVKNLKNSIWAVATETNLPSTNQSGNWKGENLKKYTAATARDFPSPDQSGHREVKNLQNYTRAVATNLLPADPYGERKMNDVQSYARQRLEDELREMNVNPPTHCSYGPVENDIFHWQGIIMGPVYSAFDGGIFNLSIRFPIEYPFKPPTIKFLTKVYHPNVDADGTIHMDILGDQWSPALTIEKLLLSICSFLPDPNLEVIHSSVSELYWHEREHFEKMAREWTKQYATG